MTEVGTTIKEVSADESYIESSINYTYDEITDALKRLGLIEKLSPPDGGVKKFYTTGKYREMRSKSPNSLPAPLNKGGARLIMERDGVRDVIRINWSSSQGRYEEVAVSKSSSIPTAEVDSHPTYEHEIGSIDSSGNRNRETYFLYSMGRVIDNKGVSNPVSEKQWRMGEQGVLDSIVKGMKDAAASSRSQGLTSKLFGR